MPKKTLLPRGLPNKVQVHVVMWGQAIKFKRIKLRMKGLHLAEQLCVSVATISRMEKGDPGMSVGTYLHALSALGLLAKAAPKLKDALWDMQPKQRMRPTFDEWEEKLDNDQDFLDPLIYSWENGAMQSS